MYAKKPFLFAAAFLGGAAAMAQEVSAPLGELRELSRQIESTRYIYIAILVVFLLAIAAVAVMLAHVSSRALKFNISGDERTRLPSFANFKKMVELKLKNARPGEYAIVSIDIDNFSIINDFFGYEVGNSLLMELSSMFLESLEEGDLICRVYADNFALFTRNVPYQNLEEKVYQMVFERANLREIVTGLSNADYPLKFSAGVYYISDTKLSVYKMINKANEARKIQKGKFRTPRLSEWTSQMEVKSQWKKDITVSMEKALEGREFVVYYQPKFSFQTGRLIGAEALTRWSSPERGFIQPGNFIPLFEQNGFIYKIDLMVFREVCRFLQDWNARCGKKYPLTISFNLSRNNLFSHEIPDILVQTMGEFDVAPSKVEVEITESFMSENQEMMLKKIREISGAGFGISIDDFGTGYSTLNILKDVPAEIIKLDKEFVSSQSQNERESIIIKSVIDMAKRLNLKTVAEGVETKEQAEMLRDMGCDYAQGFYFARPMPEAEFLSLLEREAFERNAS